MKELLTASRMNCLVACPRKHFWRYEIGLQTLPGTALRFGSAWHAAMESRWNLGSYDMALEAALGSKTLDEMLCATLAGLLSGYYARWVEEIVESLQPEIEFRHAIEGSRTFDSGGKIDGLGHLKDGRLMLLEHKTCGEDISPDAEYWVRLRCNQQLLQYVLAARALGHDVQTVLYDVTRKPAIRQKQTESIDEFGDRLAADTRERPEFYFARREVPILDDELEEFQAQRYELGKLILELRQAEKRVKRRDQAWPRNVSALSCKFCEYSSFCLQGTRVDETNPPTGFRVGAIHSELTGEVA